MCSDSIFIYCSLQGTALCDKSETMAIFKLSLSIVLLVLHVVQGNAKSTSAGTESTSAGTLSLSLYIYIYRISITLTPMLHLISNVTLTLLNNLLLNLYFENLTIELHVLYALNIRDNYYTNQILLTI